jgi:hypothetical protein
MTDIPARSTRPLPPPPAPGGPAITPESVERQLRDARVRTRRVWFADGLAELVVGFVFAVLGLYFAANTVLEAHARPGWLTTLVTLLLPVLVVIAGLAGRRAIRAAKERMVYPRIGFVSYRQASHRRWLPGLLAGLLGAATAALLQRAPGLEAWIPAIEGFFVAVGLFVLARFAGLPRFLVPGLLIALIGVGTSLLALSSTMAAAVFFGAAGTTLLLSGALALRRFLAEAPAAEDA